METKKTLHSSKLILFRFKLDVYYIYRFKLFSRITTSFKNSIFLKLMFQNKDNIVSIHFVLFENYF